MSDSLLIERLTEKELRELLTEIVKRQTEGLRKEVVPLREELRQKRPVITAREATLYFDPQVTSATIIGYIHDRDLPGFKNGRQWFLYVEDLLDWQIGLIGRHPSAIGRNVITPRYRERREVRPHPEHDRSGPRRRDGSAAPITTREGVLRKPSP